MSNTSQKHRNFMAEPMGEKPVTDLAGVGEVLGKRLEAQGFDKHGEKNFENVTQEEAVATLKAAQDSVVLVVAKPETAYIPAPSDVSNTPPPPPPFGQATSLRMASSGSFYQLPDELLVKIFSYLDITDLVLNIQHVDSRWKAIVQDISFWRDYVFTINKQMEDKEIIRLLQNMPALRALVVTRAVSDEVIQTLGQSNKCITLLKLCITPVELPQLALSRLETFVRNLPQIQHLAFPLSWKDSVYAMKYSTLIQQLHELLSLRLLGSGFGAENCFFLNEIASECPLLHEIDLGTHHFLIEDIILFLKAKKHIISKFAALITNSVEMISHLESCKRLRTLCLTFSGQCSLDIPLFDLPNLRHLGINWHPNFSRIVRNLQRSTMSNLVQLDLTYCSLDPVQFEIILEKCMQLKILVLTSCSIPNGDDFQRIRKCTNLEYLDVSETHITDLAVEIFADKCTKLKYLDISYCFWISDYSLQCLIKCRELQTLKLNFTDITGKNFHFIPLHLTKLCELYVVQCCYLEFQYVQRLEAQMSHLKVYT